MFHELWTIVCTVKHLYNRIGHFELCKLMVAHKSGLRVRAHTLYETWKVSFQLYSKINIPFENTIQNYWCPLFVIHISNLFVSLFGLNIYKNV